MPRSSRRAFLTRAIRTGALTGILSASVLLCCTKPTTQTFGTLTGAPAPVAIADLLADPEPHLDKEVTVTGSVAQVCQEMGCWFEVADGGKRLMIDLQMGRHFTVPKDVAGWRARVEGTFVREEGVLKVVGHGVELRPAS